MTRAQAEQKLSAALLEPLDRPVKVVLQGPHVHAHPESGGDRDRHPRLGGQGAQALAARGTCSPARGATCATSRSTPELAADVSYNKPAIDKLVKRVRKALDRAPEDANVDLSEGQ